MFRRGAVAFEAQAKMRRRKRDSEVASILRKKFDFARKMRVTDNKKQLRVKIQMITALETLRASNCDVGERTMSVAITTLGKIGLQQTAEELFESTSELRSKSRDRDPSLYNALLISRILNSHHTSIRGVIKRTLYQMQSEYLSPDLITYNTALKGVQQIISKSVNDPRHIDIATSLKNEILSSMKKRGHSPDTATYNLLIACSTPTSFPAVLKDFKESGEPPNASSYYSVISMYVLFGDFEMAEKWLQKCSRDNMLHQIAISTYIQGCSRSTLEPDVQVRRIKNAMDLAENKNIAAPLEWYHLMMKSYTDAGDFPSCVKQYRQLVTRELTPTYRTYTIFIDAITSQLQKVPPSEHRKYIEIAETCFLQGMQEGVINNRRPYEALGKLYHSIGRYQEAITLALKFENQQKLLGRSDYLQELLTTCRTTLSSKEKRRKRK